MKHTTWVRILSLLLVTILLVCSIPLSLATDTPVDSTVEPEMDSALDDITDESIAEPPQETEAPSEDTEPLDVNGETLTRHAVNTGGRMRARAAASSVGKSTCVEFSSYTSPYWYCNRYDTLGTHVYGHYYNCAVIA